MSASIIVPVYNKHEIVEEYMMRNLQHAETAVEFIIIDNNSDQPTKIALKKMANAARNGGHTFKLLTHKENTGVARAWNEGLRHATQKFVCILNNDCLLPPGWVQNMISATENSGLDFCSPFVIEPYMNKPPYNKDTYLQKYKSLQKKNQGRVRKGIFGGVVIWGRLADFKKVEGFDEVFWLSLEDIDFCVRALQSGFKIGLIGDVVAFHLGSATRRDMAHTEEANAAHFRKKHSWNFPTVNTNFYNTLVRSIRKRIWRFTGLMSTLQERFPV